MANTRMLYHTVEDGNGQPRADYTIHFQLTPAAYKTHASLPESVVTVTTNSAGYFETPLETGVEYKVLMYDSFVQQGTTIKYGNRNILTIVVPHGTEPIDLPTVIALDTEPDPDPDLGELANIHMGRTDNPHEVTAAQVDTYTTSEIDNLINDHRPEWGNIDGDLADQTDLASALDAKAGAGDLTAHTSNTDNPHGVTAAQTGTYTSGEIDNALSGKADTGDVPTELTDLDTSVTGAELDALKQAADQHGDIVTHNAAEFATAEQGGKADTALQPDALNDYETTAQLNARDTANRDRANHTGTQAMGTVDGLQGALDDKLDTTAVIDEDDMTSDSDAHVPTQQSVKAYVDAGDNDVSPYRTGYFIVPETHGAGSSAPSTLALSPDFVYSTLIHIPEAVPVDLLCVEITTPSEDGQGRIGYYTLDATRAAWVGTLVVDGAITTTSTGNKTAAVADTLRRGWYAVSIVVDVACSVRAFTGIRSLGFSHFNGAGDRGFRWTSAHPFGPLPSTLAIGIPSLDVKGPRIGWRIA